MISPYSKRIYELMMKELNIMGPYHIDRICKNSGINSFDITEKELPYLGKRLSGIILEYRGKERAEKFVQQYNQLWVATSPAVTFTVVNPHDVQLPVGLKVKWQQYTGWTDWVVEPFHYTEC